MSKPVLAIDGGDPAVTATIDDRWETVSDLERQGVNRVLDDIGSAYSEIDRFQEEFRTFADTRYAIATCNGRRPCTPRSSLPAPATGAR